MKTLEVVLIHKFCLTLNPLDLMKLLDPHIILLKWIWKSPANTTNLCNVGEFVCEDEVCMVCT
jgi:hypothetical protein